jgi:hypothetical protein
MIPERDEDERTGAGASKTEGRALEGMDRIQAALRGLRFGSVTAVVQDGVIVQVDRTEKVRLGGTRVTGPQTRR